MHQRHHVVGIAAVCLLGLFATTCAANQKRSQPPGAARQDLWCSEKPSFAADNPEPRFGCKKKVHPNEPLVSRGRRVDAVVYLRVYYADGVDDRHRDAFVLAIGKWNKHTSATGFVFEVNRVEPDFLLRKGAPRDLSNWREMEDKQCAGFLTDRATIWYSPLAMDLVIQKEGVDAAARIYAHELGHVLNICHKAQSLLMRDDPNQYCHDRAAKMPVEIPPDDIIDAHVCGFQLWEREHKQTPRRSRRWRVVSKLSARRESLRSRAVVRRFRL